MSSDKNIVFRYDSENDILYLSFGPPRPSYSVDRSNDIFVMKDIETGEYSGIKILDFIQRVKDGSISDLELPVAVNFKEIRQKITNH